MTNENASATIQRFFSGISEHVFQARLGVADTEMIDYVSSLLIRFLRTDAVHRIRQLNGRPATEVVTMLHEAEARIGEAKREIHRHIGDFTLFWTGLYPEAIRSSTGETDSDQFVSYCNQGKRAYLLASELEGSEKAVPCPLLRRLSDQFDLCAYGLREIRREWEHDNNDGAPILLL